MKGKEKCELLKSIRREIAEKNGIKLEIPECTHKGDCLGSCPRCEAEVKYLEMQLEARKKRGFKPVLAGISAGLITLTASSCIYPGEEQLLGDIPAPETSDTTTPEDTELHITEGSLTYSGTENIPGEVTDETIVDVLEGDIITFDPDELVLDGDIAFPLHEELELQGVMALPEELPTAGDLRLPIETAEDSPIEWDDSTTAVDKSIPETVGDNETSTDYSADTVEE